MRLGQLARKLDVRPIQIVEFLATQNIQMDNGTNVRMNPEHVDLAVQYFSPGLSVEDTGDDQSDMYAEPTEKNSELINSEFSDEPQAENQDSGPAIERGEVIKAPKIELSGLKVLGKIELPEDRKKQPDQTADGTGKIKEARKEERRPKESRRNIPKNPIALQREREALEARKKREEENRLRKERRTQNYLKKVKAPQPTKAARIFNEETQQMSAAELQEPPKSLWGRFVKWLTS